MDVYDLCHTYEFMSKMSSYYNKNVFLTFVLTYQMITTLILKLQNDLCYTYEFMSKLCSCFNHCTHIKFSLKLSPTNDFVQSVNNAFLNKLNYIKSFILCVFFFYIKINLS